MNNCKFDERQLFIRGNIFKHMTVILVTLLICNALLLSSGLIWADSWQSNMIIVMIAVAAGSNEMIFKEVYSSRTGIQSRMIILIGASSIIGSGWWLVRISQGAKIVAESQLTDVGGNFVMMLLTLSIFIGFIIKLEIKKREHLEE